MTRCLINKTFFMFGDFTAFPFSPSLNWPSAWPHSLSCLLSASAASPHAFSLHLTPHPYLWSPDSSLLLLVVYPGLWFCLCWVGRAGMCLWGLKREWELLWPDFDDKSSCPLRVLVSPWGLEGVWRSYAEMLRIAARGAPAEPETKQQSAPLFPHIPSLLSLGVTQPRKGRKNDR